MQERVMNNEKIEVLFQTNTLGLYGENGLKGAHLIYRKGESDEKEYDLPIDGFFLAIGHHPNSELFKDYLETDTNGFIVTKDDTPCTDVPGVYVAGDVADPKYRQAIIAAGSGAKAAMEAEKYLAQ
jgi:thioredoxin reductase (NADPH)